MYLYEASAWQQALLGFRQSLLDAGTEVNDALIQWQTARRKLTLDVQQIAALESAVRNSELLMRHTHKTIWKRSRYVRHSCRPNWTRHRTGSTKSRASSISITLWEEVIESPVIHAPDLKI